MPWEFGEIADPPRPRLTDADPFRARNRLNVKAWVFFSVGKGHGDRRMRELVDIEEEGAESAVYVLMKQSQYRSPLFGIKR